MNKLNFLQPDKNNLNTYLYTGVILVALSIFIVFLNSFFNKDIVSFLPGPISFFLPLILGFIGLHLIRICLLYTSPSPRDDVISRMPSSA